MRVIVNIKPEARDELLRLLEGRSNSTGDAIHMAEVYVEEARNVLAAHAGPPPDAVLRPGRGRRSWWWYYANGVWFALAVIERSYGVFRGRVRTITVLAAAEQPPAA